MQRPTGWQGEVELSAGDDPETGQPVLLTWRWPTPGMLSASVRAEVAQVDGQPRMLCGAREYMQPIVISKHGRAWQLANELRTPAGFQPMLVNGALRVSVTLADVR